MSVTTVCVPEKSEICGVGIFLAGPTPRGIIVDPNQHWRREAVTILEELGYDGQVFLPVPRDPDWPWAENFEKQVEWELYHLRNATCIVFWIPRSPELPGFTTNIEFGMYHPSGRVVLGYPEGAVHMRYMDYLARKHNIPVARTLRDTLTLAVQRVKDLT